MVVQLACLISFLSSVLVIDITSNCQLSGRDLQKIITLCHAFECTPCSSYIYNNVYSVYKPCVQSTFYLSVTLKIFRSLMLED